MRKPLDIESYQQKMEAFLIINGNEVDCKRKITFIRIFSASKSY